MRKLIETGCTLILWAVFISGSSIAIFDFFFNVEASEKISSHMLVIGWAPFFAVLIFGAMMFLVRVSKYDNTKKAIASEHTVQWSAEELALAQNGKVVDLHFAGAGLACQVVTRDEVAAVLHADNKTVHVTVAAQTTEESVMGLVRQAF
ncbi:hypothetical protein [Bdellovibrio sp. KM01]|uniref:hypothetical protein n=1 Tax=Bdellovibrio sp. KM01 TaxID=2748865 RepID=UPI0015E9AE24|nr:hypothetical protein [Bdellovibrio sp. KM01]QLY23853.1 hypothetical protein HW988_10130 [Bdellovibrio sp. KM01]